MRRVSPSTTPVQKHQKDQHEYKHTCMNFLHTLHPVQLNAASNYSDLPWGKLRDRRLGLRFITHLAFCHSSRPRGIGRVHGYPLAELKCLSPKRRKRWLPGWERPDEHRSLQFQGQLCPHPRCPIRAIPVFTFSNFNNSYYVLSA
jgi:hypothetical protein